VGRGPGPVWARKSSRRAGRYWIRLSRFLTMAASWDLRCLAAPAPGAGFRRAQRLPGPSSKHNQAPCCAATVFPPATPPAATWRSPARRAGSPGASAPAARTPSGATNTTPHAACRECAAGRDPGSDQILGRGQRAPADRGGTPALSNSGTSSATSVPSRCSMMVKHCRSSCRPQVNVLA
jgi:hypothetical protein